jgi:hypothetical protein
MNKVSVELNKPIYVGFSVLELSKTLMYSFHYDYMLPTFGESNLNLLYSDTDSMIYEIKNVDFYEKIKPDINDWFDTSGYPIPNPYNYTHINKKVLGKMKDELDGVIILEFVGLRSKLYAVRPDGIKEKKVAKGVTKAALRSVSFEDYIECLDTSKTKYCLNHRISAIKQEIFGLVTNKKSLNGLDDKRFLIENNPKTYAIGHKDIRHLCKLYD